MLISDHYKCMTAMTVKEGLTHRDCRMDQCPDFGPFEQNEFTVPTDFGKSRVP